VWKREKGGPGRSPVDTERRKSPGKIPSGGGTKEKNDTNAGSVLNKERCFLEACAAARGKKREKHAIRSINSPKEKGGDVRSLKKNRV